MLTKKELEKFKKEGEFNLWQLEKDYLQHIFLFFLSKNVGEGLIFKGGTAIQKVYGLQRFSEDLDFTLTKEIDLDAMIKKIKEEMNSFGIEAVFDTLKNTKSKCYKIKIKGPLFNGDSNSFSILRIEISLRNDLLLESDSKEIIPIYSELSPYIISVMNKEEILAEKIRAIFQRQKARDVYDIWFLLKKEIKFDKELVQKKFDFFNLKFNKILFNKRINEIEKIWEIELKGYINTIPDFKGVKKEILEKIK